MWADPAMRALQGAVPVVMVPFADVKRPTLEARVGFDGTVREWFGGDGSCAEFTRSLLAERGIGRARIRECGIAFSGKQALVG